MFLFWDASALAKRYSPEIGTDTVDFLFHQSSVTYHLTTLLSYVETYSILNRKRNDKRMSDVGFNTAVIALEKEVLMGNHFRLLPVEEADMLSGLNHIKLHRLNATDAILLSTLLRAIHSRTFDEAVFLVTADKRLIRAAEAEGIRTLNPESATEEQIASLMREP